MRVLGYQTEIRHIDHHGQRTETGVFPIGVNSQDIQEAMETQEFRNHLDELTKQFEGKSLVLSVERLDYSKGIPQKLKAIEQFLNDAKAKKAEADDTENENQQSGRPVSFLSRVGASFKNVLGLGQKHTAIWDASNTVFVFIAVPSRLDVEEYRNIEEEIHKEMSSINGMFSDSCGNVPLVYIHRPIQRPELAALYARSDVCLVTPLVDGMNLVAKEFLVAKQRDVSKVVPGTVVLSGDFSNFRCNTIYKVTIVLK